PHDTYVEVRGLGENVSLTIYGAARVKVGVGFVGYIISPVTILTADGVTPGNFFTALTIDDSIDPFPTTIDIDPNSVVFENYNNVPYFKVTFSSADLSSLTVNGGVGGNIVNVKDTRDSRFTGQITLNTGNTANRADTVNIEAMRTAVTVDGQDGAD